jgi:hypothetical protein
MKRLILAALLCGTVSSLLSPSSSQVTASAQNIVTSAQVNGTWRNKSNTFRVWALGRQKLKVEFSGTYEYKTPEGWMANAGSGSGIAFIEGDTATFRPDGADEDCKITMKFAKGKLVVEQEGGCDFGHNVIASGVYRKVSSRKPKFNGG